MREFICNSIDDIVLSLNSTQDIATGDAATIIPSYDEITLCNPAFKTLRSMVNAWLLEVSVYKNIFADYQLIHFYRYVLYVCYCIYMFKCT